MIFSLSTAEVCAFAGVEERRVRKEFELGTVTASAPRYAFIDLVYFRVLVEIGFELSVASRKMLREKLSNALDQQETRVALSSITELQIGDLVANLRSTVQEFIAWRESRTISDPAVMGGEPVFRGTRLCVRQIGGMLNRGVPASEVLEDYPYLTKADLLSAKRFTTAYPKRGRPGEVPSG
jgi:uncharacterized protein (DUF433 family)